MTERTTEPRVLPVDDYSHSVASLTRAQLADGEVWVDGSSDGGPFDVRLEVPGAPAVAVTVRSADEADALIVLLAGQREIAFDAPFDPAAVTTRS